MSSVRLLVGTSKGGFILTSDAGRRRWEVTGPLFEGWEVMHLQASPVDPDHLYASVYTPWYGNVIQRSRDGGRTWEPAANSLTYTGPVHSYKWLSGEQRTWQYRRAWCLAPTGAGSPSGAGEVLAGVEDAALFRSADGGSTWEEVDSLRQHPTRELWEPGAGGLCLHTILFDPQQSERIYVAISAAGAFRSDDGGRSWRPINRGLRSSWTAEPEPEAGYCVHRIALHPSRPNVLFQQNHTGVFRSDDHGDSWRNISEGLPSAYGFPIAVHPQEPDTVFVVPMTDDERHYPPEGALRVWRSCDGGGTWEPLGKGLPDRHCYVNVLRGAMAVDRIDPCGLYFGTTGGQMYASIDGGESWEPVVEHLPRVLAVEAQTVDG